VILVTTRKSCPHCNHVYDTEMGGCLWWLIGSHALGEPQKICSKCKNVFSTGKNFWSKLPLVRKLLFFVKATIFSWFNFYMIGYTILLRDWIDKPQWPDGESRDYVLYWTIAWYVFISLVFLGIYVFPLVFSRFQEKEFSKNISRQMSYEKKKKDLGI
jgi:hypothetical protein